MNRIASRYSLVLFAAIAACSNATPANSSTANSGGTGATGGENAGGSTAAFSGAQNNTGGGSSQAGMGSSGGSVSGALGGSSAQTVGGTTASGATTQATGGSLACGDTLTLGSVSPAQLSAELTQSHTFLLINVHVPVSGHIPGTDADIDYRDIAAIETYIGADKSKPAVIYCMSDHMSDLAGPSLVADGYCNIRALAGGMSAWRNAGYPVDP